MKVISIYFIIVVIFLGNISALGQQKYGSCDFQTRLSQELVNNPELLNQFKEFETLSKDPVNQSNLSSPIVIPLVVHVLFNTPSENVPDSQILKMVLVLNQDLGRYNSDTANTPAAFKPLAASTNIQFCMAAQDTLGNAISGIDHVFTNTVQFPNPFQMRNPSFGGVSAWNTDKYFNIWVGNAAGWNGVNSVGYSINPANHSYWGLFADFNYVRQIQLGDTSNISGRSITHTLGHCFNLFHPFTNTLCYDPDSVSDTPIEQYEASGCPSFPLLDACTFNFPGVMFMNFMDYAAEPCVNMFTIGQATRMQNSIAFYFPLLLTSTACLPVGINNSDLINNIILKPNPFINFLTINSKNLLISIEIFDKLGNYLLSKTILQQDDRELNMDLSNLSSGIYFIKFKTKSGIFYKRVIKM